jgi:hypothetical protein
VKAVAGHGLDPDEAAAVCQETAGFADVSGGNPNLGDETGGAELGELDGIVLVSFDTRFVDPRELTGVSDFDPGDEVDDTVEEIPGIGGGFDGDDVGREEMIICPVGPFIEGNFEGFEDNFLEGVDGGDIEEVFVKIDAKEPNNT